MTHLRLNTLGSLHCYRNDHELTELPGQRLRCALLVYLAVERTALRHIVQNLFWSDRDDKNGKGALKTALFELRKLLDDDCIESVGDILQVPATVAVDLIDFERAVQAKDWTAALAFYNGEFLNGFSLPNCQPFEFWIDRQRARAARLHRVARRACSTDLITAGDFDEALSVVARWAELEPFEDEAQHRHIELLAARGERLEALVQADLYLRMLEAEGLQPLDETKQLIERIRAGQLIVIEQITGPPGNKATPISRRIAVLPFEALPSDLENDALAFGTTEEIIALLSRNPDISPISSTSVRQFRNTTLHIREIARKLDVVWIAEGSVRRSGDRMRISARVVDAFTERVLWSDSFDRDLQDIFAVQSELAGRIMSAFTANAAIQASHAATVPTRLTVPSDPRPQIASLPTSLSMSDSVPEESMQLIERMREVDARRSTERSFNARTLSWSALIPLSRIWSTFRRFFRWDPQESIELEHAQAKQAEETQTDPVRASAAVLVDAFAITNAQSARMSAYREYAIGRYLLSGSPEEQTRAPAYFEQAIQKDESFAQAHAALSFVYVSAAYLGNADPRAMQPKAAASARRAVAVDRACADAHAALAAVSFFLDWDWASAAEEFELVGDIGWHSRVTGRNRANPTLHARTAYFGRSVGNGGQPPDGYIPFCLAMGRLDDAVGVAERRASVDPLSPMAHTIRGWTYTIVGRYAEALTEHEKAIELWPENGYAHAHRAFTSSMMKTPDLVKESGKLAEQHLKSDHNRRALVGWAYAAIGEESEARRILRELESTFSVRYVDPWAIALIHAGLGETERAFARLDEAYEHRSPSLVSLGYYAANCFARISADPRYASLMQRIGMPATNRWYQAALIKK